MLGRDDAAILRCGEIMLIYSSELSFPEITPLFPSLAFAAGPCRCRAYCRHGLYEHSMLSRSRLDAGLFAYISLPLRQAGRLRADCHFILLANTTPLDDGTYRRRLFRYLARKRWPQYDDGADIFKSYDIADALSLAFF